VGTQRKQKFEAWSDELDQARLYAKSVSLTPNQAAEVDLKLNQDGQRRTAYDLLSYAEIDFARIAAIWPDLKETPQRVRDALEIEATYQVYMDRQAADIVQVQREESRRIPETLDFSGLSGLSNELKQKLQRHRPANISQAARIDGMTPAAISLLLVAIRRHGETRIAS
jgi:tRNA uridine 5-carboxymethylaminomethyl modification enzyme